ncbi:MAG TPA: hypothetical protein PKM63_00055 [Panacibacter sp.]|nr:hypothetical protein [Panacibacter sp.]HNP42641.1 hypothetical protein [Panacibacter sp.]
MWKQVFKATAVAGSLDICAAFIQAYLVKGSTPDIILKYIASGLFGKDAFAGGFGYMLAGLLIHFFIAFACSLTYFLAYHRIKLLRNNVWLSSLLAALAAWTVTTRIIVPLSKIQPAPFDLAKAAMAITILFFCIGLPVAVMAKRFYRSKAKGG